MSNDKIECWNIIPDDCRYLIFNNLNRFSEQKNIASTNKKNYELLDGNITLSTFLHAVAYGNEEKAEAILKENPALLLQSAKFTDYSGRIFNTTAFKYILWALDIEFMFNMIIRCIPEGEKGAPIRQALIEQCKEVKESGVTYSLNGEIITERHYNFKAFLTPMEEYCQTYQNSGLNKTSDPNCLVRLAYEQAFIPANIAQHHCDPTTLTNPTKKLSRNLNFRMQGKSYHWFDRDYTALNTNFVIIFGAAGVDIKTPIFGAIEHSCEKFTTLFGDRLEKLESLEKLILSAKPENSTEEEHVSSPDLSETCCIS